MKKIKNKFFILDTVNQIDKKEKIKNYLQALRKIYYKLEMSSIRLKSDECKKYNVSVCAIFKNESAYLKEWIEFNHIIGIEHFYLYNNNSDDDYYSVLKPYIESGLITLMQWTKNHAQMECYWDCIKNFKNESQWIGFIDIDEFIVPNEMNNIYEFLKPFEKNRGSVKIYWKMFGTSGLIDRDINTLVTEKFTVSWPMYYSVGKCFYNTNFEFDIKNPKNSNLHHMLWTNYKGKNLPPVNAFDYICLNGIEKTKMVKHPIQINHYFTKSYSEYALKKSRGDVYYKNNPHDEAYFYLHEMENCDIDYSAYKYLIKLKLAMKLRGKNEKL